ncbi:MAG: hypothetical protein AB8E82_19445 [Aureispira sp.]
MELETRAVTIKVRSNGIIELRVKKSWTDPDTVEVALENIEMLTKAVEAGGRVILSFSPNTYLEKEVLGCYKKAKIGHVASAILVTSFGAKIVGNLFLKLIGSGNSVATKIFTKQENAEEWLLKQINGAK